MLPLSTFSRPAIAFNSSFCPHPDIPAIPSTSPLFTSKDTSFNLVTPSSSRTVRFLTSILLLEFLGSGLSILSVTACRQYTRPV